ncbi:MAG TPA: hypothetical protein VJ436_14530, partial [Anaerolineales bacterium]|nr:hypothetical protein [Anaerolineales bacterium]
PLPQIELMDGPQVGRFIRQLQDGLQAGRVLSPHPNHWLARLLIKIEEGYYRRIVSPEVLIVLRLNPEIAVQRKPEDEAALVRERSTEIWELDWEHTDAHIIDGNKSKTEVLTELKTLIWSEL